MQQSRNKSSPLGGISESHESLFKQFAIGPLDRLARPVLISPASIWRAPRSPLGGASPPRGPACRGCDGGGLAGWPAAERRNRIGWRPEVSGSKMRPHLRWEEERCGDCFGHHLPDGPLVIGPGSSCSLWWLGGRIRLGESPFSGCLGASSETTSGLARPGSNYSPAASCARWGRKLAAVGANRVPAAHRAR